MNSTSNSKISLHGTCFCGLLILCSQSQHGFLTHCAYIFQHLLLSVEDLGAAEVMRRNDGLDACFPGMPVKLYLSFPLRTYKSIISFQDESRIRGLYSFILGQEMRIDHRPHKGVSCSITAQCG